MNKPKDDFEAVRAVVAALEGFDDADQERILRWAREKIGLAAATSIPVTGATAGTAPIAVAHVSPGRSTDIRTFVTSKNPTSDAQFAATVAYFYRFEAPETERKDAITAEDLQDAARKVNRDRFTRPSQTLVNTHKVGYLDKGSERQNAQALRRARAGQIVAVLGGIAIAAQDKNTVQVPGGLAFSEFKGYEDWQTVAVSKTDAAINAILANPAAIDAYRAGVPGNGQPFPDGSKIVKIHWKPKKSTEAPDPTTVVPDTQQAIGFMVRDSKRFADSGGWGWAEFKYDAASDTFTPFTLADNPPQGNDAKCGFACHTIVKAKDYVFTAYQHR